MIAPVTPVVEEREDAASSAADGSAHSMRIDVNPSGNRPKRRGRPRSARSYERIVGRLHGEAEQLFTQGQFPEAERRVRRLLSVQQQVVGRGHPDFALGLSMLGELRFLQDDLESAERYFRKALAIRGRVLGHRDPDYAVSLVCLGGVLWRRGESEEAERRFREALAIRYEMLGDRHPESVQTRKELARLLRRRGDWAGAQALSHGLSDAGPVGPTADRSAGVVVLAADLANLGERLAVAARLLRSPGMPVPDACLEELADCRRVYERLRDETLRRIEALQVPAPAPRLLGTLQDLAALLDDLAEAEGLQAVREIVRRRAVAVLERVLALDYSRDEDFPPLRECQHHARQLVETIEAEHWSELPAQTEALAEGTHSLVSLLTLVEHREALSDREWAELHEQVGEALGRPMAVAASRARLFVADVADSPQAPDVTSVLEATAGRVDVAADPVISDVAHAAPAPELTPAPTEPEAPAPLSPQPELPAPVARRTARRRLPIPAEPVQAPQPTDPNVALLLDMAVASLVPTMGTVINFPTASPSERDTHRLLKVGQAPNVVQPGQHAAPEQMPGYAPPRRRIANEIARRYSTYHRIGRGVIAGPMRLIQSDDSSAGRLMAEEALGADALLALLGEDGFGQ